MRNKLALCLLFASVIAVFAGLVHFISKSVVSKGVNAIELRDAEADMKELYSLLNAATIRFKHHVFDWAVFDEAHDYIQGKDDRFITRNFTKLKIDEMHFTGTGVYDINGNCRGFVDGSKLEFGEEWIDAELQTFYRVVQRIKNRESESSEGYVNVKGVPMLVAVHKIYDSAKDKPFNGYLIMGRALDSKFREQAQNVSGLQFSILPLKLYNTIQGIIIKDNIKFLETPDEIRVFSVINDIFGEPAFSLELRKPRTIAAFGREISRKNFLLTLALCVLVLCAGLVIIHLAQRRVIRDEMDYRAKHDSLTGLPNVILFRERLEHLIKEARHDGVSLGVAYVDIDNFKSLNDGYGYQQGDAILREMAKRLRRSATAGCLARFGAAKYLVAVTAESNELVVEQARNIRAALHEPLSVGDSVLHIEASIGIGFLSEDSDDSLMLEHRAEYAMTDARKRGGNAISLFDESMRTAAVEKHRLEVALREAVESNAFTVHYQPQIDIEKNDVAGCEALVRWQTGDGRWVPPPAFIPIAEENGLVTRIDMFVLRTACRQVLAWQKDGSGAVPVSVNMSVRSILSDGFADEVKRILKDEGTPPSLIDIEITESSFMTDMKKAFEAISRLHEADIRIELDDFGTGYSSLQYLSAMPISVLKIDKAFVDEIFSGKEAAQPLVRSIISLATSLGMHTVSEGVEDKKQLAFLVGNGAHVIQGYLFSKPLNAADCGDFLRNRKARIDAVMKAA